MDKQQNSAPICQQSIVDPRCDGVAVYDLDGSGEPYLCATCERNSRGQGNEEARSGALAGR